METLHIETPLLESTSLSQLTGKKVWLKMEALQPSGSFKIRGIGRLCQQAAAQGVKHFIASSGGNAGMAVAYAGRRLGRPVTVFVPKTTSHEMCQRLQMEGAQVVIAGAVWDEANEAAIKQSEQPGCQHIHPFDHPIIWQGHATIVHEVVNSGIKPDAVVLAVGGGGLLCGVAGGLHEVGWQDVPILSVETEGAASYAAALRAGGVVCIEQVNTVATSLGTKLVAEQAFQWSQRHPVMSTVVSDRSAIKACASFLDDHRVLVEPACGAALSVLYDNNPVLKQADSLLVVVCGGANVSRKQLRQWERETLGPEHFAWV